MLYYIYIGKQLNKCRLEVASYTLQHFNIFFFLYEMNIFSYLTLKLFIIILMK